jgi:hypothetical protein
MPSQNIYVGASGFLPIKIFPMMSLKTQDRQPIKLALSSQNI